MTNDYVSCNAKDFKGFFTERDSNEFKNTDVKIYYKNIELLIQKKLHLLYTDQIANDFFIEQFTGLIRSLFEYPVNVETKVLYFDENCSDGYVTVVISRKDDYSIVSNHLNCLSKCEIRIYDFEMNLSFRLSDFKRYRGMPHYEKDKELKE
ncbi:hypothetical protein [Methanobrevibacter sp. DSM 116169]|uniref:hypothetical protein n=1 Tax=Methanobrevibacter sp. DSM 116169 TaxID=3242727 RepID=UPI0038FC4AAD